MYDELLVQAPTRAAGYTDPAVDADPVRTPILRHWYQRCYLDTIRSAFALQRPLETVTQAEATIVAACVESGEFRRIIGADGVPIVTTAKSLTETGQSGLGAQNQILRRRVTSLWVQLDWPGRLDWARAAGLDDMPLGARWSKIPGTQQSALIAHWLDTHRQAPDTHQPLGDIVVDGELITNRRPEVIIGPAEAAAAEMFHRQTHDREVGASSSRALPAGIGPLSVRVAATLAEIRARQVVPIEPSENPRRRHRREQAGHTGHDQSPDREGPAA